MPLQSPPNLYFVTLLKFGLADNIDIVANKNVHREGSTMKQIMNKRNHGSIKLGAAALAFMLALTACGGSQAPNTAATDKTAKPQANEIDWKTVKADIRFVFPGTSEA